MKQVFPSVGALGGVGMSSLLMTSLPAAADSIRCVMEGEVALSFDIDRTQFAPPFDRNEPPRQKRTMVRYGDAQFPATPFYLGDARGFEAEALGGAVTLFVMQANGAARISNARDGTSATGTCTINEGAQ